MKTNENRSRIAIAGRLLNSLCKLNETRFSVLFMLICLQLISFSSFSQLDVKHYIPPMHARVVPGSHYLVLGTPVSTTFNVTVRDGAGNLISTIPISSAASSTTLIGSDYGSPFMVPYGSLNTAVANGKGLILTASEPFYASIRATVTDQAGSLTSKGEIASKGKDFWTAHMFNNSGASNSKSNCFSFMATENSTTVVISGIKTGVVLEGVAAGTTSITVQLNQGQSYVVSNYLDNASATNNVNGLNGTHITSDKDIVVNCGTWLGGNALNGTTPTGTVANGKDIGIDQIVPVENVGKEYVLIKGFGVDNERTIVVASEDNTQLFLDGNATPVATLNAGDFHIIYGTSFSANNNLYLTSSAPIFVTQTINGASSASSDNEHCGGLNFIPPLECTGDKKVTIPNVQFLGTPYIQIIADAGALIQANGTTLTGALAVTGTSNYVTYSVAGYSGDVQIVSTLPVRVALINVSGNVGAAGYFSGFSKEISISATLENNGVGSTASINEACGTATILFERLEYYASNSATINISVSGSATEGVDYSSIPNQVIMAAGQTQVSLDIAAFADDILEGDEEVILTFSVSGSVCNGTDLSFIIKNIPPMEVQLDDQTLVCQSDSVLLAPAVTGGTQPYSYVWSTGETSSSIYVSPQNTSNFSLTVLDACEATQAVSEITVTVPINNLSVQTGNDTTLLCPYTPISYESSVVGGTTDYSYLWTKNGVVVSNSANLNDSPSVFSQYIITVTDFCGLEAIDTVEVTITSSLLQLEVNEDRLICPNQEAELWGQASAGLPPYSYFWPHSGETDSIVTVNPSVSTTYSVIVSDACATYEVIGNPYVEVDMPFADFAVISSTVVNNLPIYFANYSVGGVSYAWDFGNGETSTLATPGTTYLEAGTYTVTLTVTNEAGCSSTVIHQVTIKPEFYFFAPNAFTPDGSEFNNAYNVSVIGAKTFEFYVFNRWGELIFESHDPEFLWDGTYDGRMSQDNVYVYQAIIVGNDDVERTFTGHISLLK